jgi:hypothetical protein
MTKHAMDKVIAQYSHWMDRPYEPEPQLSARPPWRAADVVGLAVAWVLAGAGITAILA